jgi:hypothetical protein
LARDETCPRLSIVSLGVLTGRHRAGNQRLSAEASSNLTQVCTAVGLSSRPMRQAEELTCVGKARVWASSAGIYFCCFLPPAFLFRCTHLVGFRGGQRQRQRQRSGIHCGYRAALGLGKAARSRTARAHPNSVHRRSTSAYGSGAKSVTPLSSKETASRQTTYNIPSLFPLLYVIFVHNSVTRYTTNGSHGTSAAGNIVE